ncbi:MAG: HEAT repeat domain-containing protein [Planctomycetes bacterium]|nr:HEAT repeat domain-containing protein [Planctomycetota bacterium]
MSAEGASSWGSRMAVAAAALVFIGGMMYYYVKIAKPQKEIGRLKKTIETASDPWVKAQAIHELVEKKDLGSASILIHALNDEDAIVRRAAAAGLGMLGAKKGVEPLKGLLTDKAPKVRQGAVEALGLLKEQSALAPIVKMLKDKDKNVQRAAIFALQRIGDKSAVKPLKAFSKKQRDLDLKGAAEETITILETGKIQQRTP